MKCPICSNVNLVMTDRQGIEIDYCPDCRGVWLDRGELDKLIERSSGGSQRNEYEGERSTRRGHGFGDHGQGKKKKRGSLLGELFDF